VLRRPSELAGLIRTYSRSRELFGRLCRIGALQVCRTRDGSIAIDVTHLGDRNDQEDSGRNSDVDRLGGNIADDCNDGVVAGGRIQWVAWSGGAVNSRQAVVNMHLRAFSGDFKDTHRSDTVKSIHYLGPDLASVDDYWTMTGAKKGDGSDWPYRAGYVNFVMAKRNGRWLVSISHSADFNAQAPPAAKAR
jgi:uncharacterized protein (TIGR02246 family)